MVNFLLINKVKAKITIDLVTWRSFKEALNLKVQLGTLRISRKKVQLAYA